MEFDDGYLELFDLGDRASEGDRVMEVMETCFRAEFLYRVDEIIIF